MDLANDIKRIRLKTFLTQEAFAKELGVSFNSVNRWENGKQKPSIKVMKAIDEYCKKNKIDYDVAEKMASNTE